MKLKPIPQNTVVHTPTEAEAKELLAILHEDGWKWNNGKALHNFTNWNKNENVTCYKLCIGNKRITYGLKSWFVNNNETTHTLTEFKERYCEEEQPQPKFKVGDKVRVVGYQENCIAMMKPHVGEVGTITKELTEDGNYYEITCDKGCFSWREDWLEPYPKPESKPTEDMETKELNLCELLRGHEGETFYSPVCGTDIELKTVFKSFLMFYLDKDDDCTIECETRGWQRIGTLDECGTFKSITYPDSACLIFPSRALYEQYPLDPYTAWMKWREEQKKYLLEVKLHTYDASNFQEDFYFRTPADRDKCIEEIKAIIEKY